MNAAVKAMNMKIAIEEVEREMNERHARLAMADVETLAAWIESAMSNEQEYIIVATATEIGLAVERAGKFETVVKVNAHWLSTHRRSVPRQRVR